jgi:glycosyltransferase involved in cell wall biosynthesis
VGTLEPRKNIPVLIETFEQIRKAGRPEKLIIIGKKGWHYDESLHRIHASPLSSDIIVKGFMDEPELSWHYHHASAFVYPSLYEGFGLPILESMACGCPVVTSNTSSIPEVVGDAGLMAPPMDAKALAGQLLTVLTQPALARELARRGRERAHALSWENTARQTLQVYQSILASPGKATP